MESSIFGTVNILSQVNIKINASVSGSVDSSNIGANHIQVTNKVLFLKTLDTKFSRISMKVYKVFKLNDIICLKLQITYFKDVVIYVRY